MGIATTKIYQIVSFKQAINLGLFQLSVLHPLLDLKSNWRICFDILQMNGLKEEYTEMSRHRVTRCAYQSNCASKAQFAF